MSIPDVLTYRGSPHFNERERAALEFCERITRDDLEVSGECFARLREHFAEAEIVELTFIIGYQTFASPVAKRPHPSACRQRAAVPSWPGAPDVLPARHKD